MPRNASQHFLTKKTKLIVNSYVLPSVLHVAEQHCCAQYWISDLISFDGSELSWRTGAGTFCTRSRRQHAGSPQLGGALFGRSCQVGNPDALTILPTEYICWAQFPKPGREQPHSPLLQHRQHPCMHEMLLASQTAVTHQVISI